MKELDGALAAWRTVLGDEAVTTCGPELVAANQATLAATGRIAAILSPTSRNQVQACLAIATRFEVAVYPVSLGRNWGYGSRLPPRGEAVLLSLAGLDRILRLDETMAMVRIGPGVSFAQLGARLAAAGSRLLPPWTGSGPNTSILGNVLERGIGKGLYEDMAAHACGFEVVLADGTLLDTGPVHPAGVAGCAANGPGPGLRDLFVQSNLGVVTAMDFWLHPAPALQQMVWARLPDGASLRACIEALRPALQHGDPWFRAELVSTHRAATQGSTRWGEGGWLAVLTLWGDSAQDLAGRNARGQVLLQACGGTEIGAGEPVSGAQTGMDADWLRSEGLRGAYAAKPGGMPANPDPDRDRCGVVWIAPALPMVGEVVAHAVACIAELVATHGFGPAISLRQANGRTLLAVIGLFYDRDEAGGDERAAAAAAAVHLWLQQNQLAPYRLGLPDLAQPRFPTNKDAPLQAIKKALDPACVLSPGRYLA